MPEDSLELIKKLFKWSTVTITPADEALWAKSYVNDQYTKGEDGYHDPDTLMWFEVSNYPISRLNDATDAEWFKEECIMWEEEGQPDRYNDMLDREIVEPIVVFDNGNSGYIWDGNHRVGASVFLGKGTIKATVGIIIN